MFQPLFVAATGLETFEQEIGDITNNISNARTIGFKKGRTEKVNKNLMLILARNVSSSRVL